MLSPHFNPRQSFIVRSLNCEARFRSHQLLCLLSMAISACSSSAVTRFWFTRDLKETTVLTGSSSATLEIESQMLFGPVVAIPSSFALID